MNEFLNIEIAELRRIAHTQTLFSIGTTMNEVQTTNDDSIEVTILTTTNEGAGLARHEGVVVFVDNGVPGDKARITIRKRKKNYWEGSISELITPSPFRVDPPCPHFGICGGCAWQHIAYEEQLALKRQHVVDAFRQTMDVDEMTPLTLPSASPYFYRNKMEYSFSDRRWLTAEEIASGKEFDRSLALGLHVPGRFDGVIDIEKCFLQSEASNRILDATREYARVHSVSVYSSKAEAGYLRFLVIRSSHATSELMVNLVTSIDAPDEMKRYTEYILRAEPSVTTVVNNITARRAQVAQGEFEKVYHGSGMITEHIGDHKFQISANSFFQTNSEQIEKLYGVVNSFAALTGKENVWDLYSGAGTISLFISDVAHHVLGIELAPTAVEDARANAKANGIENVSFVAGDLRNVIIAHTLVEEHGAPDVIIVDPPRSGMHPDIPKRLVELAPKRIVYVSCNPATQARDIAMMLEHYSLERMQPVDMFPQTTHVENVALLVKK